MLQHMMNVIMAKRMSQLNVTAHDECNNGEAHVPIKCYSIMMNLTMAKRMFQLNVTADDECNNGVAHVPSKCYSIR